MITHTLNLELAKKIDSIGVPIVIRTMDNETQTIAATLFMHGQDYAPACDSARLDIMHEDGAWAHVDAQVSGNVASATLPSKALGTGGAAMAYFAFIKGKQIETTESFALRMEKSAQATPESDRYFDASINRIYEKWKNFEAGAEHAEDLRKAAEVKRESDFADAQARHETAYTQAEQARTSTFNQAEEERTHAENARVSAEGARADAEQARVSAESARVAEESSRTGAEQARAAAESKRDSAEQARTQAETTRDGNEDARKQAETARNGAEDARQQAEQTRANDENTRESAEQERVQAEQTRDGNESTRKEQEQSRAAQEGLRAQAESARKEQESLRQAQEQARVQAETTRNGAEQARTQAEDARTQAEQKRDLAEGTRAQAEALRVAEESKRKDAEKARTTEEDARKTRFTQMMDAAQNVKFKIVQADDNGTPLGEGVAGIIYLVRGKTDSATNEYTEWIWYEGKWELFGTSGATVEPITTQDIDTVAQDGTISGTRVLSATALNYLWTKLEGKYQTQAQVTAAVSAATQPLAAKLQTLDTTKADKQALEDLKASVNTDVKQQLQTVRDTLATKASADSVSALDEKAATKDALQTLEQKAATKDALAALDANKADKQATQSALAAKADTSALNDTRQKVQQLEEKVQDVDFSKVESKVDDAKDTILKKLDGLVENTFKEQYDLNKKRGYEDGQREAATVNSPAIKAFLDNDAKILADIASTYDTQRLVKSCNTLYGRISGLCNVLSNEQIQIVILQVVPVASASIIKLLPYQRLIVLMQKLNTEDTSALMQKLNTEGASALMQKLNTEGASALMQKLNTEGASALMQKLNTEGASALMQKLNTEGASALMQKLAYSDVLTYAYLPHNKADNIRQAISTDSLWYSLPSKNYGLSNDGRFRYSGSSHYNNWIVSICSANYGSGIDNPYDGETFESHDKMVQITSSYLTTRNSPGKDWDIVLFFPRSSWEK